MVYFKVEGVNTIDSFNFYKLNLSNLESLTYEVQ